MTDFSQTFVGELLAKLAAFADHLWHTKGVQQTVATAETGVQDAAKQALTAGLVAGITAKSSGGDIHAVEKATGNAMLSVGAEIGTETAAKIVEVVTSSLHPTEAPVPPVPATAPAGA